MQAVHFLGNGKVAIEEFPVPQPDEDQVLLRVMASGICGSELHSVRSEQGNAMNSGHEVCGVIEDPNGHPQWQKGDRVCVFTLQGCGVCQWCLQGKDTFCNNLKFMSPTHSQFCTSRARAMVKLPDDVPFEVGVLLGADGLGVPYGATMRAGVQCGDITCVFGCGPVGLGNVLVQSFLGAHVIAVEPSAARRDLALKLGAWQVLDPTAEEDLTAKLKDLCLGIGPDKCFECTGRQDTLDVAMNATRPEGVIVVIGHGKQSIDPQKLIIKRNLTMMGNWIAHPRYYPQMLQMWRDGLALDKLITAVYPYQEAQKGFDEMLNGTCGKVILSWQ